MDHDKFDKIEWPELIKKCKQKSEIFEDYWDKAKRFCIDCSTKSWKQLSYKQVNWLTRICEDVD